MIIISDIQFVLNWLPNENKFEPITNFITEIQSIRR